MGEKPGAYKVERSLILFPTCAGTWSLNFFPTQKDNTNSSDKKSGTAFFGGIFGGFWVLVGVGGGVGRR